MNNIIFFFLFEVDVVFNVQFNIGLNLVFEILVNDILFESYCILYFLIQFFRYEILSVNKVRKLLKEFDVKKVIGLDNISCNFLKLVVDIVAFLI